MDKPKIKILIKFYVKKFIEDMNNMKNIDLITNEFIKFHKIEENIIVYNFIFVEFTILSNTCLLCKEHINYKKNNCFNEHCCEVYCNNCIKHMYNHCIFCNKKIDLFTTCYKYTHSTIYCTDCIEICEKIDKQLFIGQ